MLNKITPFRYIYALAVIFTLINAIFFIGSGVAKSIRGYKGFFRSDFLITEGHHPGLHLLETLDAFMISLVFMIFGLGIARLFIFDKAEGKTLPKWLKVNSLEELKVLLWRTIFLPWSLFPSRTF
ncbi:MAG: YqhA family protein [Eudoraea sp.]|uniref:YqhA family protein n=1 Tax=Eudoraea sp. TaxID=1979955 RepID=UPI003C75ACD2